MALKLYLAGPDVFLREAVEIGRRKKALCRDNGHEGLFPLDNDVSPDDAAAIFAANRGLMDRADAGLFNLSPFRGPSADAGTVFELGYMAAQGKPVFGYSNTSATYEARVAVDAYEIERFGLADNLMIAEAIRTSGGDIAVVEEKAEPRLAAMAAFGAALAILRTRVASRGVGN